MISESVSKFRNLILLLVLALFTPSIVGFQYVEWFDTNHLFIGIMGPILTISYSDMYLNDWLFHLFPNILILTPRLLFAFALVRFNGNRADLNLVHIFGVLLIVIEVFICFTMMTVNSILGTPPGVLILLPTPNFAIRLFVPVPILLLAGVHQIRSIGIRGKNNRKGDGGPGGI